MRTFAAMIRNCLGVLALTLMSSTLPALEPGDVIINEVFLGPKGPRKPQLGAVELLVVKDGVNLNGLTITDRDTWDRQTEDQCTLQDMGQGFLNSVRSGTLIVIYNAEGEDVIRSTNFVLRFHAKSSLYCNTTPTGNAFRFTNKGDNLHLIHFKKQIDFLKYRADDVKASGFGEPGSLFWEGGPKGFITVGPAGESMGIRFLGNRADLNDFQATWKYHREPHRPLHTNLGKPNGGPNTDWVRLLRDKSKLGNVLVSSEDDKVKAMP